MAFFGSTDGQINDPFKPQLQHSFMKGLRFDTEVEYLDEQGQWRLLCPDVNDVPAYVAAQIRASLLERVHMLLNSNQPAVPETMQQWQLWLDDAAQYYQAQTLNSPLPALAAPLLKGLSSDGVIVVQLALPKDGKRWMLVTGVECEHSASDLPKLRSLLVLDPQEPAVWACGHNARVTFLIQSQIDSAALQHKLCIYRSLDGGYLACRVRRIVVIQARL
ncbi:hypothetical protein E8K88_10170 [Lampropedia aestuarii]|uniref:Uncharacterized protein n=1 Tax=Lampropedia aestuarii TaxID=2562762 RepID=A0A4S5BQT8_9BURK|nr:hypothetical protein [Lampropedia aestuarii]THJ33275.1 hypothetical protein E8K88_10170 [Lampropedia aestuarii]